MVHHAESVSAIADRVIRIHGETISAEKCFATRPPSQHLDSHGMQAFNVAHSTFARTWNQLSPKITGLHCQRNDQRALTDDVTS